MCLFRVASADVYATVRRRPRFALSALFRLLVAASATSLLLSACAPAVTEVPTPTDLPPGPTIPVEVGFTPVPTVAAPVDLYYVDVNSGSDEAPGTQSQPWASIERALESARAGSIIYVRAGVYETVRGGWRFQNSGTEAAPITLTNFPGEQVVIRITHGDKAFGAFTCWVAAPDPPEWQTPKADFIHIIGSDVPAQDLGNGFTSTKGIVIQGVPGVAAGIEVGGDCDNWEIAGIDFVGVGYAIFTKKRVFQTMTDASPDHWYVHDNRVYGFYRESGMQFNGNYNLIQNNQIYKVTNDVNTPFGCQTLNLNGNNNIVSGNILSRLGSNARCMGILLEWDLADANLIEHNTLKDVGYDGGAAITIAGGDRNVIRYNILQTSSAKWFLIYQRDPGYTGWPCNEQTEDDSDLPPNNPAAPDYPYYYPHDCRSADNQIYANTWTRLSSTP